HHGRRLDELGAALSEDGDEPRAGRKAESARFLPGHRRVALDLYLDDDEALLLQLEQPHEAVLRHLVLDEPEDVRRRADGLVDPEELEQLLVARVVDARDRLADAVALLRDLGDDEIVLVVARDGEHELRGGADPGPPGDGDLRPVPTDAHRPELLLEPREAVRPLLDQRDLVSEVEQGPRHVRAHLPPTRDHDVHQAVFTSGTAACTVSSRAEMAV